jgi:hypothetical protein
MVVLICHSLARYRQVRRAVTHLSIDSSISLVDQIEVIVRTNEVQQPW